MKSILQKKKKSMKEPKEQICAGICAALLLGFLALTLLCLCEVTLNIDSNNLKVPKKLS